ncbi:MAG: sugar isomerase domain-containing protein [Anaerolineae bacterium]
MTDHSTQFLEFAIQTLERVKTESDGAIREAAQAIADAISNEQLLFLFGSGHSALVARDGAGRAGGLVPAVLIEDVIEGDAERIEGMARIIVGRFALDEGGVLIVISNSGINAVPIEMAMLGKEKGLKVVAITSLTHSKSVETRHSSGKKLYDVADIVIDTHGARGDSALDVPNHTYRTGATSTMVGCAIIQAMTAQAVAIMAESGKTPPILVSANVPEGTEHNRALLKKYQTRLARYQLPLRWE